MGFFQDFCDLCGQVNGVNLVLLDESSNQLHEIIVLDDIDLALLLLGRVLFRFNFNHDKVFFGTDPLIESQFN